MRKKNGRPAANGTAVGLKPYLSDAAIRLLQQQKSQSQFVAHLIEREAIMNLSEETIALIQQAAMDLATPGVDLWDPASCRIAVDEKVLSFQACNFRHYLKVVTVNSKSWKVIPVNNAAIINLGQTVSALDSGERWVWYLATTPKGDFGIRHWIFEGRDYGLKVFESAAIPAHLLAALATAK